MIQHILLCRGDNTTTHFLLFIKIQPRIGKYLALNCKSFWLKNVSVYIMQRSFGDEVHLAGHHYPESHINIPTWSPPRRCWQEAGMSAVRILHLTKQRDGCAIACQNQQNIITKAKSTCLSNYFIQTHPCIGCSLRNRILGC